jgi:hypothetical protein
MGRSLNGESDLGVRMGWLAEQVPGKERIGRNHQMKTPFDVFLARILVYTLGWT